MDHADVTLSRSLEGVIARFQGLLRAVSHRYGLSAADADELAQEVRIRLWRALKDHEKIAGAAAFYVQRTALSAAVDLIRRRRARHEDALEEVTAALEQQGHPGVVVNPHQRADETAETRAQLTAAVDALSPPRDVVVRLYLAGYDRGDIVGLTGWTEPKVRNLLYRGLDDLRTALRSAGMAPRRVE